MQELENPIKWKFKKPLTIEKKPKNYLVRGSNSQQDSKRERAKQKNKKRDQLTGRLKKWNKIQWSNETNNKTYSLIVSYL